MMRAYPKRTMLQASITRFAGGDRVKKQLGATGGLCVIWRVRLCRSRGWQDAITVEIRDHVA
jgi:hypothetical protein